MDTCVKRVVVLMVFTSVVLCQGAYRKLSLPLVLARALFLQPLCDYKKTEKVRNLKNNEQA